jgi:plasmid stabilization system protein ParE
MAVPVAFTVSALEDIEAADAWWRLNRPLAPDAIEDELIRVVEILAEHPGVGQLVPGTRHAATRKLVLRRIDYLLFYRVTPTQVEVLRFWHGRRGARPRL